MSRKQYECFKCRDSGFPGTLVYLAGKDEQNRTIQLVTEPTSLKIINAKLDRIISLLESQSK